MHYNQVSPDPEIARAVKSYWHVDSGADRISTRQKIVPDGFPELVVHFGDPYRINLTGEWKDQEKYLVAGQIRNHFFLENTGRSCIIGIKMQPTTLFHLFNLDMSGLVDKVVSGSPSLSKELFSLLSGIPGDFGSAISYLNLEFKRILNKNPVRPLPADLVCERLLSQNGSFRLSDCIAQLGISERQLERQFRSCIGLSPKFYSRLLRFTYIFDQISKGQNPNSIKWGDITYDLGFYDQSHFIKNFREFTGESPSNYGFTTENLANLFLLKK